MKIHIICLRMKDAFGGDLKGHLIVWIAFAQGLIRMGESILLVLQIILALVGVCYGVHRWRRSIREETESIPMKDENQEKQDQTWAT